MKGTDMTNDHDRFIASLLAIPGWREEKPLKRYRVFAYDASNRRILIDVRCAIRAAHKNKLSESVGIGYCGVTKPEKLFKYM